MQNHNLELLKSDRQEFLRESKSKRENEELPLHQLVCPASSVVVILPVVSVEKSKIVEKQTQAF